MKLPKRPCSKTTSASCCALRPWHCKTQLSYYPECWLFSWLCLLPSQRKGYRKQSGQMREWWGVWKRTCAWADTYTLSHTQWKQLYLVATSEQCGAMELEVYKHEMLRMLPFLLCTRALLKKGDPPSAHEKGLPANTNSSCEHVISSSMAPKGQTQRPKFNFHAYLSSPSTLCKYYFVANTSAKCFVWIIAGSQPQTTGSCLFQKAHFG